MSIAPPLPGVALPPAAGDAPGPESPAAVSLALQVETPENVVLTFQLAGPAIRAGAYAIDLLIRGAILVVTWILLRILIDVLPGSAIGLFLVVLFLMEWAYFVFSEGFFRGRTIGKAAMGLRVVHEAGYPISLWAAMTRNLLRFADALPAIPLTFLLPPQFGLPLWLPAYGVGLVAMALSPKLQRLGDLAAGTVVISERHVTLPREPVILEKIHPIPRQEIGAWAPPARTLSLIDRFLGRRYVLSHERGHELARALARSLARRLAYRGDPQQVEQYPMAFLARVYVTFLRREEDEAILLEPETEWRFDREMARAGRRRP